MTIRFFLRWVSAACLVAAGCSSLPVPDNNLAVFSIRAPGATEVDFFCSCDGFEPRPAARGSDLAWSVSVSADRDFSYFFVVDGRVSLPDCSARETDDLGATSCIFMKNP
ncbi:MAG: hypothetical protein HKM93_11955 [Desulfobacteraceae bacterium]|nr:hypothetical protein [Desulfobacteraceae bacterium]